MDRRLRSVFVGGLLTASLALSTQPALAGCSINVNFVNKDSKEATVHIDDATGKSQVKIKGGWWAVLPGFNNYSIPANGHWRLDFTLDFGCSKQRRYRFLVGEHGEGTKTIYKPSSTGWTTTINLTVNINF
jgi:hypothetical protein